MDAPTLVFPLVGSVDLARSAVTEGDRHVMPLSGSSWFPVVRCPKTESRHSPGRAQWHGFVHALRRQWTALVPQVTRNPA